MEDLIKEVKNLDQSLKSMNTNSSTSLAKIFEELKEIRKSRQFLSDQHEEAKERLATAENKITQLSKENNDLTIRTCNLEKDNKLLQMAMNDLEQYSCRDCVEIKGIEYTAHESTDEIAVNVAKKMGLTLTKADISVSHRLNYQVQEHSSFHDLQDLPPKIIAKFISRNVRDNFTKNKKKKIKKEDRIYINESLTKENRQIFSNCLQYKKKHQFKYIWTKNGKTLLKKNDERKAIMISNTDDLVSNCII